MKLRMSKPALRRIVSGLGCMVLGAAIVVMPNIAAALDIGGIAQSLKNQFGFVGDLIGSAIFIAGIVVGPAGLFECYKATKDRGRGEHTYVRGGLQTLIGSAMIGLPILQIGRAHV